MHDEDETMNGLESEPISWKELIGATLPAAVQQSDCLGIRDTQNWADLAGPSHIYPEYENRVRNIIMTRLGYLPNPNVIAAYDTFLRAAAHALDHGHLKIEQYDETANALVRQIRNKDMILYDELNISQSLHTQYEEQKNTFSGLFVRDRIINMLGQTLDTEITLPAELILRFIVDEGMSFDDRPNEFDIRALTIIGYRKALLEDGKEAANQSPLWYYDFAQSNGYFETQGPYARIPNMPMSH